MLKDYILFRYFLYLCTQINEDTIMKQTVDRLQEIESQMETIGENIRKEGQVYRAELEERQRLGLHGEAAIKHYNEWMKKYGMEHLMVKEDGL